MTAVASPALLAARLAGVLAWLGDGGHVLIGTGTRPADGAAYTGWLADVPLASPSGEIFAGWIVLAMADAEGALAIASGLATWGRLTNGAGEWAMDFDVSGVSGTGDVLITQDDPAEGEADNQLWAGGRFRLGLVRVR